MTQLIPVDHDPFTQGPKLIPVDHDPFSDETDSAPAPAKNFFQRVGTDIQNRAQIASDTQNMYAQGQISKPEEILQLAGKSGAGLMNDIAGEGIKSAVTGANYLFPEISGLAKTGGSMLLNSPVGRLGMRALQNGEQAYNSFKQQYPRPARDIESVVDIGMFFTPVGNKSLANVTADAGMGAVKPVVNTGKDIAGGINAIKTGVAARGAEQLDEATMSMKSASQKLYQKSAEAGAILKPDAANDIISSLDKIVPEKNTAASQSLYGKTLSAIGDLKNDVDTGDVSLQTLDRHRQILGNIAKDITNPNRAQEAEAASRAISAIDEQVNSLGPQHLVSGSSDAIDALNQGRAQWAKAKKFEAVSSIIQKSGGDPAKLKSGFARFVNNKKNLTGFTDQEREALRVAATNTINERILKGLSRFGIDPNNTFLPIVTEGLGSLSGHGVGGTALIGAGTVARQANKYLARGKAENVLKAVEAR